MNFWIMLLLFINFSLLVFIIKIQFQASKKQKTNPELDRTLNLVQSKIAIVEDLADRTDKQVQHLIQMTDQKIKDLSLKMQEADRHISKIEEVTQKSLEVASIFQDKIPHEEILQRQNTIKYVKAAKMAHQGYTTDEIVQKVQLTPAEIDLIVKMNKEQLVFCENSLPDWVKHSLNNESEPDDFSIQHPVPVNDSINPQELVHKINESKKLRPEQARTMENLSQAFSSAPNVKLEFVEPSNKEFKQIRQFEFPKIN